MVIEFTCLYGILDFINDRQELQDALYSSPQSAPDTMAPAPEFASLLEPLRLGPITLKNRILMSALTRNRSVPTNVPNTVNVEYYKQRAAGGAGLIVTEGVLITPQG